MTERSIRFTDEAEIDFEMIRQYSVERFGVAQAERYSDWLLGSIIRLVMFPERGRSRMISGEEFRELVVRHHVIRYQILTSTILIVRVFHGGADRD